MIVHERPIVGIIFQTTRFPVEMVLRATVPGAKAVLVPRGHWLLVSPSGLLKVVSPSEYALRYEPVRQLITAQGQERPNGVVNERNQHYKIVPRRPDSFFTPDAMAGDGVR